MEFVAGASQPPQWFASHWWGEPVLDFARCVNSHAELRHISADAAYWVCAYANCQWDFGGEIVDDPEQTSFMKAMRKLPIIRVYLYRLQGGQGPETAMANFLHKLGNL